MPNEAVIQKLKSALHLLLDAKSDMVSSQGNDDMLKAIVLVEDALIQLTGYEYDRT